MLKEKKKKKEKKIPLKIADIFKLNVWSYSTTNRLPALHPLEQVDGTTAQVSVTAGAGLNALSAIFCEARQASRPLYPA